ncbi:hypothetical protein [Oceanospirillum sediminis]|uniref:Uncharacterized protein n=1 Tax=Oceanospirillum sediminis TaxID=2760088 RepID=A0A839IPM8_9GAMM|nr:hypothetical protein [Oceanospirillum sediminis]MBB1486196.1 hypothetical protein [Oceanospirillum sediminis]
MTTPIEELKIRAKKLLKTSPAPAGLVQLVSRSHVASDTASTKRHADLKKAALQDNDRQNTDQHNAAQQNIAEQKVIQLKHCQRYIARQFGFSDWEHARQVLSCESYFAEHGPQGRFDHRQGYGEFWYPGRCTTFLNHWCRDYSEALTVHQQQGGYLLPYKHQFMVVQQDFIQALGLDANDPIWQRIGYNWCEGNQSVRQQLAFQRIMAAA